MKVRDTLYRTATLNAVNREVELRLTSNPVELRIVSGALSGIPFESFDEVREFADFLRKEADRLDPELDQGARTHTPEEVRLISKLHDAERILSNDKISIADRVRTTLLRLDD